jgi:hypothetical protein
MSRLPFYSVVAPRWRARSRPTPGLGSRPLLLWQVVRETYNRTGDINAWGYEHVSSHLTYRAAVRAAWRAQFATNQEATR